MQEAVTTRREIKKKKKKRRTKSTNAKNEIAAGQRKYLFKVLWAEEREKQT